jgi:hypothetical protein
VGAISGRHREVSKLGGLASQFPVPQVFKGIRREQIPDSQACTSTGATLRNSRVELQLGMSS